MVDGSLCSCEVVSHSPHGPIQDHEQLLRVIVSPHHINQKTGKPTPAAFSMDDLLRRGLSLLRRQHLGDEELARQASKLVEGKDGKAVVGVMAGTANAARSLLDETDNRAFCVFDDAQPDQPMHATIIRSAAQSEPDLKRLRGLLMLQFGDVLSLSDAMAAG
ncbi:hypothetical protein [Kaistia soli]|uniref:hypothetical protein n=1 Tax=Kaistia soli TaxID=446684 RepID=UPI0009353ED7|nr:hypothetical protein [Kaistia soli]